jgi:hypothetical protein
LGVGSFWLPLIPFILETIKDKFKLFKKHRQEILKESNGKKPIKIRQIHQFGYLTHYMTPLALHLNIIACSGGNYHI